MKILILLITFVLLSISLFSQKEYNNWLFGNGCYITFNNSNSKPIFVDSANINVRENSSVISTKEGELSFYSYDKLLCNNRGDLVNDILIDGAWSSAQGGCMFRISDEHYVRVGSNYQNEYQSSNQYVLSCVNIYLSKQDTIVSDKQIIHSGFKSESIQIIKGNKSKKIYLIAATMTGERKSKFNLYSFKDSTFQLINELELDLENVFNYMKYNPFNQLLVGFNRLTSQIILIKFNEIEETLDFKTSFLPKQGNLQGFVSAEFSSNGNYIYYLTYEALKSSLYVIQNINSNEFNNLSITELTSFEGYDKKTNKAHMQLGPNFKIYIAHLDSNYLSSIENPNNLENIGYIEKSVNLKNSICKVGLPNIPTTFYNLLFVTDSLIVCLDKNIELTSELYAPFQDTIYSWTGPNDFTSNLPNPIINNADATNEGVYYLTVFNGDSSVSYQRETYVKVLPAPIPEISVSPDTIVCKRDFVELSVPLEYIDFEWTTGEKTHLINVYESGVYGVTYTNEGGCTGYAEVNITFEKDLIMDILGETKICEGFSTTLSADRDYETYLWSTGESTKSIEADKAGKYVLTIETIMGCTISDTIEITYHPKVQAQLNPTPTTICNGDSTLLESRYDVPYYIFEWNTGATTRGIYASETGTYKLRITDTRTGCSDSTEIAIKVEDNLQPTITGSNICSGQSATLTALPNDPSYTYEWSNGATTPVIEVSQAGTYTVTVSKAGCTGTAEIIVNESPSPEFEIQGESIICNNETATLTADKDFEEYLWSTNEITKSIEVTEAGTYTLTVTDENGCSATKSFKVEKYELNFTISKNNIDFGKVYISETKTDSTTLTNNSGFAITLENGEMVQNGQIYEINYDFTPRELGFFGDDISVHIIEPCDTTVVIPITARVYARATISTDDIYTEIGRTETVPVYLECEADLPTETYEITTDIDRSVFFTSDSYIVSQNQPINKARTKIHELTGTVLLSDALVYDITFPNYKFDNTYIEVTNKPGKIYIDSICVFNYRNIAFTEPTTLTATPTPATEQLNISITTGMQGTMHLELVSTDGRVIYKNEWHQTTRSKQLQLDTRAIPSGLYQLRLITPYDAVTTSVVVVE